MLFDRFNRNITYLRISVTDRCNYRCVYCKPDQSNLYKKPGHILSAQEITSIAETAAEMGITKIRLTGGEPLEKNDIEDLVAMLSGIKQIQEICITTNGSLLTDAAHKLKRSGLSRVNISMDSLDPEKYRRITGGGNLRDALCGVEAAYKAGLTPVKINMVVQEDTTHAEINRMEDFCRENGAILQKIKKFSLYGRADNGQRTAAERPPSCSLCNRIRLTPDGFIKPCLFSDEEIKVDFSDITASIDRAVAVKPENGSACRKRSMSQIGG